MKSVARMIVGLLLSLLPPVAAYAADDPFFGTWRLDKMKSIIANDPGVKSKAFVFAPSADGVLITETLEMLSEKGEKHVSQLRYAYGKLMPQGRSDIDSLLVVKADSRTFYWIVEAKGHVASQLQIDLSADGKRMTFRYLWSAGDPAGKALNDRYVYERQ